jgi:hypothetical protein
MDSKIQALQGILEFLKQSDLKKMMPKPEMAKDGQEPGLVVDEVEASPELDQEDADPAAEAKEDAMPGDEMDLLKKLYEKLS